MHFSIETKSSSFRGDMFTFKIWGLSLRCCHRDTNALCVYENYHQFYQCVYFSNLVCYYFYLDHRSTMSPNALSLIGSLTHPSAKLMSFEFGNCSSFNFLIRILLGNVAASPTKIASRLVRADSIFVKPLRLSGKIYRPLVFPVEYGIATQ